MTTEAFERFIEQAIPQPGDGRYEAHPSSEVLEAFAYEQLTVGAAARVSAHVATCAGCTEAVGRLRNELAVIDGAFQAHLERVPVPVREANVAPEPGVFDRARRWLADRLSPEAISLPRVVALAGAAAAVILCVNVVLDRTAVPPIDPLASAAPVMRWWVHLYWLLIPLGGLVAWRLVAHFRRKRK